MSRLAAIILAAGQGVRMRSKLAKVLHPVCGRPMVLYAVDLAETLAKGRVAVVVGYQAERVKDLGPVLGSLHPVVAYNIERLEQISGLDEVSFHMSGTEAVMQAVRLARYHTRRKLRRCVPDRSK